VNNRDWKTAALLAEIERGIAPEVKDRSSNLGVKLKRVDPRNSMWTFEVKASPQQWKDKKSEYQVRVKVVEPGRLTDLEKADVRIACNCAFWQWQGPEYWAKTGDYLYGPPRGTATAPKEKDPLGKHRLCKHAQAVVSHMRTKGMRVLHPR
jgi:hypothetical protein